MKKLIILTLAGLASASFCFGKNFKITEEEAAFVEAERSGKAIAFVIG